MATEAQAAPRTRTAYLVFQQVENVTEGGEPDGRLFSAWEPIGQAEGLNDIDAIKAATLEAKLEEGTFVAVPARSFRVRTIKVETTRRVNIA